MRVGIVGGGQLARMLAQRARPLGMDVLVVASEAGSPASDVAPVLLGSPDDPEVQAALAACDVVTYESEQAPLGALQALSHMVPVHPHPRALELVRDRLAEKRFLRELGIPTAPFRAVSSESELRGAVAALGLPAVLKTRFDGYDGKGQRVLRSAGDVETAWRGLSSHEHLILEGFVDFDRELSLVAVRDREGRVRLWAPPENAHVGGILRISRSPAPNVSYRQLERGREWIERIGSALDYVGVMAVELFSQNGRWIANEMACRVHNSGHWTIEGADTSQFENHLRAIAGLPLGSTRSRGSTAMVNLIGTCPDARDVLSIDSAQLHLYGKAPRPGRKLGHVAVQAADDRAREAALLALVEKLDDEALFDAMRAGRRPRAVSLPADGGLRTPPWQRGPRSSDGSRSGAADARSS